MILYVRAKVIYHNDKYQMLHGIGYQKKLSLEYIEKINQLRYDLGYIAPCHAFADNMQELSDLMRYLDKVYCIGNPRITLMNLGEKAESDEFTDLTEGMLLSDDMAMNFKAFGRQFDEWDEKRIITTYQRVYDRLMAIRFNMLHVLCLGHIMRDSIMKISIAESIFDDTRICDLMEKYQGSQGIYGDGGGAHE